MNNKRITYRDIAQALGLSKMTVSYSLRNDPRISETTRIRVQQKAAEMGYVPDPMLSALVNYRHAHPQKMRHTVLAWINFHHDPKKQRQQEMFNLYWKGALAAAHQLGFQLEEFCISELSLQRMHSIFKARGIRGILLTPTPKEQEPTPEELAHFPWQDYSLIRFGESLRSLNVNVISSAQVPNTILAYEQIQKKGYQRIGFVGQYIRHHLFSAGYLWAQQPQPKSRQLKPLYLSDHAFNPPQLERLKRWLEKQNPDAILCATPHLLEGIQTLGIKVPDNLGLASMTQHDNPINAGIDQNPSEIGRTALQTLASQLNENSYGIPASQKEILVEGRWVDGPMLPGRNAESGPRTEEEVSTI